MQPDHADRVIYLFIIYLIHLFIYLFIYLFMNICRVCKFS